VTNGRKPMLWERVTVAVPYLWLLVFFLAPFLIVFQISFTDPLIGQPPYTPAFGEDGEWQGTVDNYRFLFSDELYGISYLKSVWTAAVATLFCLLLGFPMAYAIARSESRLRNLFLLLVILPFWISFLLRVYAWMGLMNNYGIINNLLLATGIIDRPLTIMYTDFAVYVGLVYSYLPFMILPLYATLERLNEDLVEAAMDLGAGPWAAFRDVTWPLARPGVIAGCLLVFIPAIGEYVIPYLLGGPESLMIGRVLFDEFFVNRDWPLASTVAIVLLTLLVLPIVMLQRQRGAEEGP